jgi:hypothetical protein
MALSKRMRRELEKRNRVFEAMNPKLPPPLPPPWTDRELEQIAKMESALNRIVYQPGHDIDAVFEFLENSHLFEQSSQKVPNLRSKANHYRTLSMYSAKEKLWSKAGGILSVCYDLMTELSLLRNSRSRGGTSVQ